MPVGRLTPNRRKFGGVFQRPSACHLAGDEASL
jgi:hypothetical protein